MGPPSKNKDVAVGPGFVAVAVAVGGAGVCVAVLGAFDGVGGNVGFSVAVGVGVSCGNGVSICATRVT